MSELWNGLKEVLGSTLAFFFDLIPSYGVGIVLLTIAINLLVFPLTLKQTRATRAFQAIQPEIRRVQKEYKEKPEEMQKELMRVQREAGASPGGCLLPLLVQMPIWFALFQVLSAPLQYLPDGSALAGVVDNSTFLGMNMGQSPSQAMTASGLVIALPYLLMLILMVATQYVQTWHSTYGQDRPQGPQAGAQQVVTKVMPLFIGFISWNFPAGLVLYWATANLFRLGQQVVIFKIDGRPTPVAAIAEAKPAPDQAAEDPVKKPQPGSQKKQQQRRRRRS